MFKKKSCLNCAYVGNPGSMYRDEKPVAIEALPERTKQVLSYAVCFHEQWRAKGKYSVEDAARLIGTKLNMADEMIILDKHSRAINLSKHSCKFFFPLDDLGFRTLERCWDEQQDQMRRRKDSRRFLISTFISFVTAVAVVATAYLTWRN